MIKSLAKSWLWLLLFALVLLWGVEAQAQKKIRFAYPSSADMGDIPSLLAWARSKRGLWC